MGLIKVRCNVTGYKSFKKGHVYFAEDTRKNLRKFVYLPVFRYTDRKPVWVNATHFTILENNMTSALNAFKPTDVVTIVGRSPLEVYEVTGYGGAWINEWVNLKPLTVEARKRGTTEAREANLQLVPKPSVYELIDAIKKGRKLRLLVPISQGWVTVKDPSVHTLLNENNIWHISPNSQLVKEFTIPQPLQDLEGVEVVYVPDLATGGAKRIFNPTKADVGYATEDEAVEAATSIINAIKAGAK